MFMFYTVLYHTIPHYNIQYYNYNYNYKVISITRTITVTLVYTYHIDTSEITRGRPRPAEAHQAASWLCEQSAGRLGKRELEQKGPL